MATIIKYGSEVIRQIADLDRISRQIKDNHNGLTVVVTVALGDTTDRIANVLYLSYKTTADQVFGLYKPLLDKIGDSQLKRTFYDSYRIFDSHLTIAGKSRNIDEMQLAAGDSLTAHVLHAYLRQAGIHSRLLDAISPNFPLRLIESRKEPSIDLPGSRAAVQSLKSKDDIIIIPGYAGNQDGLVRTLGRGGGDTAAFAYTYAFEADRTLIVAEDALTRAPIPNAKVVSNIDLVEAWGAGFFGGRLKTHRSVEPLSMVFKENPNSEIFITGNDMGQRKTGIKPVVNERAVRFIASRHIDTYGIIGNTVGLYNILNKTPADWFNFGGMTGELGIGVSERGRELVEHAIRTEERKNEIGITYHDKVAMIGVVGSGMREEKGTAERVYGSLRGINIVRTHDPRPSESKSSLMAIMVALEDESTAIESLHRELFENG